MSETTILRRREDVEPWAVAMSEQCLNEDARRLVASAAGEYLAIFDAIDRHYEALKALEDAVALADPEDETSRMTVKLAALRLKSCPGEVEVRSKMIPLVVHFIAKAQAANRGEADATIVKLREFVAKRERSMEGFGPAAKTTKAKPPPRVKKGES